MTGTALAHWQPAVAASALRTHGWQELPSGDWRYSCVTLPLDRAVNMTLAAQAFNQHLIDVVRKAFQSIQKALQQLANALRPALAGFTAWCRRWVPTLSTKRTGIRAQWRRRRIVALLNRCVEQEGDGHGYTNARASTA